MDPELANELASAVAALRTGFAQLVQQNQQHQQIYEQNEDEMLFQAYVARQWERREKQFKRQNAILKRRKRAAETVRRALEEKDNERRYMNTRTATMTHTTDMYTFDAARADATSALPSPTSSPYDGSSATETAIALPSINRVLSSPLDTLTIDFVTGLQERPREQADVQDSSEGNKFTGLQSLFDVPPDELSIPLDQIGSDSFDEEDCVRCEDCGERIYSRSNRISDTEDDSPSDGSGQFVRTNFDEVDDESSLTSHSSRSTEHWLCDSCEHKRLIECGECGEDLGKTKDVVTCPRCEYRFHASCVLPDDVCCFCDECGAGCRCLERGRGLLILVATDERERTLAADVELSPLRADASEELESNCSTMSARLFVDKICEVCKEVRWLHYQCLDQDEDQDSTDSGVEKIPLFAQADRREDKTDNQVEGDEFDEESERHTASSWTCAHCIVERQTGIFTRDVQDALRDLVRDNFEARLDEKKLRERLDELFEQSAEMSWLPGSLSPADLASLRKILEGSLGKTTMVEIRRELQDALYAVTNHDESVGNVSEPFDAFATFDDGRDEYETGSSDSGASGNSPGRSGCEGSLDLSTLERSQESQDFLLDDDLSDSQDSLDSFIDDDMAVSSLDRKASVAFRKIRRQRRGGRRRSRVIADDAATCNTCGEDGEDESRLLSCIMCPKFFHEHCVNWKDEERHTICPDCFFQLDEVSDGNPELREYILNKYYVRAGSDTTAGFDITALEKRKSLDPTNVDDGGPPVKKHRTAKASESVQVPETSEPSSKIFIDMCSSSDSESLDPFAMQMSRKNAELTSHKFTAELSSDEDVVVLPNPGPVRPRLAPRIKQPITIQHAAGVNEVCVNPDADEHDEPRLFLPSKISQVCHEYQREAIEWLWRVCGRPEDRLKRGGVLALDMGLGKTLCAIAFMHCFQQFRSKTQRSCSWPKCLVVAPVALTQHWYDEVHHWSDQDAEPLCWRMESQTVLSTYRTYNKHDRIDSVKDWHEHGGVLIISYSSLGPLLKKLSDASALLDCDVCICDEAHEIKNRENKKYEALAKVKCSRRICMTGYPLQNNATEYFVMVDFARPGVLGTLVEFENQFGKKITQGQLKKNASIGRVAELRLRKYLVEDEHVVFRRDVSCLAEALFGKTEVVIRVSLDTAHMKLYRACASILRNRVAFLHAVAKLSIIESHPYILKRALADFTESAIANANAVQTLQSNHDMQRTTDAEELADNALDTFSIFHEHKEQLDSLLASFSDIFNADESAKTRVFKALVEGSIRVGDKVVAFTHSLRTLDVLVTCANELFHAKADVFVGSLHGSLSSKERQQIIAAFESAAFGVLIATPRVAGVGLNLSFANRVIIFEEHFNPMWNTQSACRVYRHGQTKQVFIYRIVAVRCIGEQLFRRANVKRRLTLSVVDGAAGKRLYDEQDLAWFGGGADEDGDPLPADGDDISSSDPVFSRCLRVIRERDITLKRTITIKDVSLHQQLFEPDPEEAGLAADELAEVQAPVQIGMQRSSSTTTTAQGAEASSAASSVAIIIPASDDAPNLQIDAREQERSRSTFSASANVTDRSIDKQGNTRGKCHDHGDCLEYVYDGSASLLCHFCGCDPARHEVVEESCASSYAPAPLSAAPFIRLWNSQVPEQITAVRGTASLSTENHNSSAMREPVTNEETAAQAFTGSGTFSAAKAAATELR